METCCAICSSWCSRADTNAMKSIRELVASAKIGTGSDARIPSEDEIRTAELQLGFRLPDSYREFVQSGGLSDFLRISNRVLSPSEMVANQSYLRDRRHVPFADNGCGDLYCWPLADAAEPSVIFADHETGQY